MKLKTLLILLFTAVSFASYAQDGGVRGKVVSRNGRVALNNVEVTIESLGVKVMTDNDGFFALENLPAGSYTLQFSTPDFEPLDVMVRVGTEHVQDLKQIITLLWTFKLPWQWAYHGTLFHPGVAQFAFCFYSVMLTSTVLGLVTMVLFKPRSWCVYCPMGTMTQLICKARNPIN